MSDFDNEYDDEETLATLAQAISHDPPLSDGEPVEALLTKFVLVAEWMDADGNRWLTRRHGTGQGGGSTIWDAKGMMHEGLFGTSW